MNIACVVLAGLRLVAVFKLWQSSPVPKDGGLVDRELDIVAFASLCAGNASQFFLNFTVARPSGRWIMGHGPDRISEFRRSRSSEAV